MHLGVFSLSSVSSFTECICWCNSGMRSRIMMETTYFHMHESFLVKLWFIYLISFIWLILWIFLYFCNFGNEKAIRMEGWQYITSWAAKFTFNFLNPELRIHKTAFNRLYKWFLIRSANCTNTNLTFHPTYYVYFLEVQMFNAEKTTIPMSQNLVKSMYLGRAEDIQS